MSRHIISENQIEQLHALYLALRARCEDAAQPHYKYYGARGVRACDRWRDARNGFALFLIDIGAPQAPATTLTRINPDGNYEPNNVQWQQHHKSTFAPSLEQPAEAAIDAWLATLSRRHKDTRNNK